MKYFIILFLLITNTAFADYMKIMIIGESTSLGYYDGTEHEDSSIPLMIKQKLELNGMQVQIENKAVSSTTFNYHAGLNTTGILTQSKSNIVIIQLGINDAIGTPVCQFIDDVSLLIENCKQAGKIVYILLPNKIAGDANISLEYYAYLIERIGVEKSVSVTNSGIPGIPLNDLYHPTPAGYEILSNILTDRLLNDAPKLLARIHIVKLYLALLDRAPDKEGLDYWENEVLINGKYITTQRFIDFLNIESSENFVDLLYLNLMDRYPDIEGRNYWLNYITANNRYSTLIEILNILSEDTGINGDVFQSKLTTNMRHLIINNF